ncbi:MAG: VWA domain-containing protein [Gammaproteobacteria bacterium]
MKLRALRPIGFILAVIVVVGYVSTQSNGSFTLPWDGELDRDEAIERLAKLTRDVGPAEAFVTRRAQVELGSQIELTDTLPAIDEFPLVVVPASGARAASVEIFVSTEKSGSGTDGWMVEVAQAFNRTQRNTSNGKPAQVAVRKIASGTGYQYIASGKYRPQAFSPSNHLWIRMAEAYDVKMTPVRERLVGNVAGIVMKEAAASKLEGNYESVEVRNVIDAVVRGDLAMGYTNPFASSTGLNFLVTVLSTFSAGDETAMLSPEVLSAFEGFQRGVPFVALTTLQMRDSVARDGSLEAFVMEQQTFAKTPALQSGYRFVPFGIRHDNPLYAVGEPDEHTLEVLEMLAKFAEQPTYVKLADEYGFNPSLDYTPAFEAPAGDTIVQAQRVWKEKKDAGRPIAAVFLCDVSGSMRGERLWRVKQALLQGSEFISANNAIGMVTFSDRVSMVLPVQQFDLNHKSAFRAAVEDMDAAGNTAMYDGVVVSLSMLSNAISANPKARPMLFVLTDGETNRGLNFSEVERVITGVNVPVYTIGYEADLDELGRLSQLVEAASINADQGEIEYKIGSLLNAQM